MKGVMGKFLRSLVSSRAAGVQNMKMHICLNIDEGSEREQAGHRSHLTEHQDNNQTIRFLKSLSFSQMQLRVFWTFIIT